MPKKVEGLAELQMKIENERDYVITMGLACSGMGLAMRDYTDDICLLQLNKDEIKENYQLRRHCS